MPSVETSVGGNDIPLVASAGAPIQDRAVVVLLDYLAFWLRYSLNDALDAIDATTDVSDEVYNDACPAANLYPYDPKDTWPLNPKPALYMWWSGPTRQVPKTLVYSLRERVLTFMWIYASTTYPDGQPARAGLPAMVDATMRRALERGRHPGWSYGSHPANSHACIVAGVHGWTIVSSEPGMLAPVVDVGNTVGQEQNVYMAVRGTIQVSERIYDDQPLAQPSGDDPSDVLLEQTFTVRTNELGDPLDKYDFAEFILPKP